jgi:6-phosphogluconate dehydrogenase
MANGVAVPGFSASLGYFDTYRRAHVPANLVQVRRTTSQRPHYPAD